jgi:hypothetical protein
MHEEKEDVSFCKKLRKGKKKGRFGRGVVRIRLEGRYGVDGC